ncbi:MAG: hypothetical protein ACQCN4_10670 [Candidatus Bathyarchaeia archaeon]
MKRTSASIFIAAFALLTILSFALPETTVSAQTTPSIKTVDHQVQVMYSGNVAVIDTIHLSGPASDSFTIAVPLQYSADVLKAIAYDDTRVYQVNLGVPLGDQSAFYGAQVDFNGYTPTTFTVAFILSNNIVTDNGNGNYTLNYPAYPCLAQEVESCSTTVTFPSEHSSIAITKEDGDTDQATYAKSNLPAYTYIIGSANVKLSAGAIQLTTISNLNRQITIDPTGTVTVVDSYRITGNTGASVSSFVLSLPPQSSNVVVRDSFGAALTYYQSSRSDVLLVNATLSSFINKGQSTSLTAQYNLPGATLQGDQYVLSDFQLFPDFQYLVQQATMIFNPPEGATIVTPQVSTLDSASTLTRTTYQDTLTITENSISYVDYLTPQQNTIQLTYHYNPVWVSFRPTFWAAFAAAIGCVGAVIYQKRRPREETYKTRAEKLTLRPPTLSPKHEKHLQEIKTGQPITADIIRDFLNIYEDRKELKAELIALEVRAHKGKVPRRQYKVQRKAIEVRIESLTRSIERTKAVFRGSSGNYPDLIRQLDLAEEDLAETEENMRNIAARQSRGEISLEAYKKEIASHQKLHDKADAAINGILLRLREKIR